jgi:hypothetical protein
MNLREVLLDVADAVVRIDASGKPFRAFRAGAGPYGEPQLVKLVALELNSSPKYGKSVQTKRTPDLLVPGKWAIEVKITRPFGDNGSEAENWSVNLLHPYRGNVSTIGDCFKLTAYAGTERRAILVIGYEHTPAVIDLTPLIESFETIAQNVAHISLSERIEICRSGLVHPVHQCVRVFGWEVLTRLPNGIEVS